MSKNKKNQPIWNIRVSKNISPNFQKAGSSLKIDKRLFKEDIMCSIVHTEMLCRQKIISLKLKNKLIWGLNKIKNEIIKKKIYHFKHGDFTYPLTKQLIFDGKKNKVLNKRFDSEINITLFHGSKDEVVPIKFSKKIFKIFNNAEKKLVKIKNGNHSLSRKKDLKKICFELNEMIFDYF